MKQYEDRLHKKINNRRRHRGKKKWKKRLLEFIRANTGYYLDRDLDYNADYYDKDTDANDKENIKEKNNIENALVVVALVIMLILIIATIGGICYNKGYNHKFEEEYDSMYQIAYLQIRDSAYYEGFIEGLSAAKTDGIERKAKLINAYNSLIRYEGLSEIDQKAYTYRLNELLKSPVPDEEKVDEFIKDVQEILSSDT